jgi:hypothetical protein
MNFACSIDVSVAPMDLLNDGSMKIGSVGGGDSTGIFPRAGTGMGSHSPTGNSPLPSLATTAHSEHNPMEFVTPLSHDEDRIDAFHDGEPLR